MPKDVYDEWEVSDIDRDEQKAGLKRRKRRWKEIELEQKRIQDMEKKAKEQAEKVKKLRQITVIEKAWLKCDYILHHIMDKDAYEFMFNLTRTDPEAYKYLYKIFMSPYMMERADYFVLYFSRGGKVPNGQTIPLVEVIKHYRKYKGIETKIVIKRKDEEYELGKRESI